MRKSAPLFCALLLSLSARRAWIEIFCPAGCWRDARSLSARRAWIEIDWASVISAMTSVALRKESVDRNSIALASSRASTVALRKESVDRNCHAGDRATAQAASLSARRAWIEIGRLCDRFNPCAVALRKESVDRNYHRIRLLSIDIRRSPQGERG